MPIGIPELVVILVIALVIFGPKKIPEIANALGKSINEFKRGTREIEASVRKELEAGEAKPASPDASYTAAQPAGPDDQYSQRS